MFLAVFCCHLHFLMHSHVIVPVMLKTIKTSVLLFISSQICPPYAEVLNQMCAYCYCYNPCESSSPLHCVITAKAKQPCVHYNSLSDLLALVESWAVHLFQQRLQLLMSPGGAPTGAVNWPPLSPVQLPTCE